MHIFGSGGVVGGTSYSRETLLSAPHVDPDVMTIINVCRSNGGVNPIHILTRDQIIASSLLPVLMICLLSLAALIRVICM